jgi:HTH-like domain
MRVQGSELGEGKAAGSLSVEKMCQVAVVSRAGYYRSFAQQCPDEEEMMVRSVIQKIVVEHRRRYGYRRVWFELNQKLGMVVNHKRVLRLDRGRGLKRRPLPRTPTPCWRITRVHYASINCLKSGVHRSQSHLWDKFSVSP